MGRIRDGAGDDEAVCVSSITYYCFLSDEQILLMTIYDKDEAVDLTPSEKKALKNAIAAELNSRAVRRSAKHRIERKC
jgi:hypothetical protein